MFTTFDVPYRRDDWYWFLSFSAYRDEQKFPSISRLLETD